jgi:hypothetical protein
MGESLHRFPNSEQAMARASKAVSDECSALAFYGIRPSAAAAEAFYHMMVKWFTDLGYPPDKAGVTAPGFGTQLGLFGRFDAKLKRTGFRKVTGVTLITTTPRAKIWGSDNYVSASYMGEDDELVADIVARSSLATLSANSLLPVAREVAGLLKPVYGIGFTRAHRLDPTCYAIGLNFDPGDLTPEEEAEQDWIGTWGETLFADQVYRKGILRDVYRWNFLTRPHLRKKVNGVPLELWIRRGPRRGRLGEFGRGTHLWEVPAKDIPKVRQSLLRAGLILEPEDEEDEESGWTPEESLAFILGDQPLDDVIVFDGTGKEVPTEEVKKIVRRGRRK